MQEAGDGRKIGRFNQQSGGDPCKAKLCKAKLRSIRRCAKCDAGEIPGVVAMAANGNEVIYQGAFGKRDLSKDDAMTRTACSGSRR